jgi:hypothetical protein
VLAPDVSHAAEKFVVFVIPAFVPVHASEIVHGDGALYEFRQVSPADADPPISQSTDAQERPSFASAQVYSPIT